ncbi:hypothetical protein C798_02325 [Herbaspirillum rubrisubalbicans Os34]|uniref:Uncharacterized protein n=1 Tax=Herbaspirillum rubrisubalbicans Os34 TaxID=1235827 RepID=A0A6M3ZKB3_9BURK|nr:hypothetical protein C798_02325 [Herbaspirillum rubrisubalbicans Os34]
MLGKCLLYSIGCGRAQVHIGSRLLLLAQCAFTFTLQLLLIDCGLRLGKSAYQRQAQHQDQAG